MIDGFFGGSFDPPHEGHLGVARGALRSGCCDRVVWVPAFSAPHKRQGAHAAFEHRLRMVELAIAGESAMTASDFERQLALTPSYTFCVLTEYRKRFNVTPVLLIGSDSLLELHLWHRAAELVGEFGIFTYPRAGALPTPEALLAHWPRAAAEKLLRNLLPGKFFEISSTELRNSMVKSSKWSNIKSVTEYIEANRLYQTEPASEKESDHARQENE